MEFDEDPQGMFENGNEDAVVVQLDDINSLQDLLEMSNGPLDGGLRQMMDEGGLMDFAFALSLRDQNRQRNHAPSAPEDATLAAPSAAQAQVEVGDEADAELNTVDAIFSTERQRQFAMKLVTSLLQEESLARSIVSHQLLVAAISSLNPDDVDEVQIIDQDRV